MEARDLDEARDKHIQGFLGKLMVRDLRHMARARGVEGYKEMKKKDLADSLFSTHFMQKRDKEKFAIQKTDDPLPNPATKTTGIVQKDTLRRYDLQKARPGGDFAERAIDLESHPPPLPAPKKSVDDERVKRGQQFLGGMTLDTLRNSAARMKLKGYSTMNRQALIDAIITKSMEASEARKKKDTPPPPPPPPSRAAPRPFRRPSPKSAEE